MAEEEAAVLEAADLLRMVIRDPGNAPWNCKEQRKHVSSTVREPATCHPETVTFDQSIGTASPGRDTKGRPDDNTWAAGVPALSASKIKWAIQYTPNDPSMQFVFGL